MKKLTGSLPFRLLLGVAAGILIGLYANEGLMNLVVTLNYIMGQFINFCVPLIIIGFIAPSITKLGSNASRTLFWRPMHPPWEQPCFPWQQDLQSFPGCPSTPMWRG